MNNWSVDIKKLKNHPRQYRDWRLEQMINFGLKGKKLNKKELESRFNFLSLDPAKKKFLSLLLRK